MCLCGGRSVRVRLAKHTCRDRVYYVNGFSFSIVIYHVAMFCIDVYIMYICTAAWCVVTTLENGLNLRLTNAACCIFTWLVSYSLHSNYWSALKPSNHWVPSISRSIYNTLTTFANWIGSFRLMFNLVSIKRSNSTNALSKIQLSTLEIFLINCSILSQFMFSLYPSYPVSGLIMNINHT